MITTIITYACAALKTLAGNNLLDTLYRTMRRNVKYQPFLQMSELPVQCCGTK